MTSSQRAISKSLGRQLDVLPPTAHAIACRSHLRVLASGMRHLKLGVSGVTTFLAADAVLPQMQGLHRLKLTCRSGSSTYYRGCSCLSRMTALKELKLNLRSCHIILRHLACLTTLQHLHLGRCTFGSHICLAHLSGLTALQHLNLRHSWTSPPLGCVGCSTAHLRGLTKLQHLT
jgi:hypothetical protein